jgi:uncharacterized protein
MSFRADHLQFVLKVASRCNLNCSYCYMYNKADSSWARRPPIMSDEVLDAALTRIRTHCLSAGQEQVSITFHGGEPCLVKPQRFEAWCRKIERSLKDVAECSLSIQTNGTLLSPQWAEIFLEHKIDVGVSVDGLPHVHDSNRIDHQGKGSYAATEKGLSFLRAAGVPLRFLCVIQPGRDGLAIHRHLAGLGAVSIDYLLPDHTHDTIQAVRKRFGPHPCADYLLPILDDWFASQSLELKVKIFWNMAWLVLGGDSRIDMFGNRPLSFLFVDTDGSIQGLDVLRVCGEGVVETGLNVRDSSFIDVKRLSEIHRRTVFEGVELPAGCAACAEADTCGGGYLPHRYSAARHFDNPSVWCRDLLMLFARVRELFGVDPEETALRHARLARIAGDTLSNRGRRQTAMRDLAVPDTSGKRRVAVS